ncbi:hypothetical protein BRE01_09240 [Brevibacillus reuszeri]|uniref:DUF5071 domain-containing protein n=2 Tax=Brevibacillus reuszeri TaxID=54915 RepID=A0ABQ0TH62_9BACL|nr:hypothetical protein BRE01_09240 [Brevibacillus reuszeri]
MSMRDLIPKDKHDLDSIWRLQQHSAEEISEILPELFEWLQDINWPVANELTKVLPKYGDILIPHIEKALRSGDPQWQFSLLQYLIRELSKESSLLVRDTIQQIADNPTPSEILEEIHLLARETLQIIGKK